MQAPIEKLDAELDGILLNAEMGAVTGILQREMAMQNESSLDRLAEVRRQIHAVKCGVHPVARLVSPEGLPMPEFAHRFWASVPESAKLQLLQDRVDWSGITNKDMAMLLLSELDVTKLTNGQRDMLRRLGEPELLVRGKLSMDDLRRNGHHKGKSHERGVER